MVGRFSAATKYAADGCGPVVMAHDRQDSANIDVLIHGTPGIHLAEQMLGAGVPVPLLSENIEGHLLLKRRRAAFGMEGERSPHCIRQLDRRDDQNQARPRDRLDRGRARAGCTGWCPIFGPAGTFARPPRPTSPGRSAIAAPTAHRKQGLCGMVARQTVPKSHHISEAANFRHSAWHHFGTDR